MRPRLVLLAAVLVLVVHAAAAFPRIDASGFRLVAGATFATYGQRIAQLEQNALLARAGRAGADPRRGQPARARDGFCWQDGEDREPVVVAGDR